VWTFNYSREQYSTYWLGIGYDDRDLDLHAKYPFGHLFEHNIVERIASDDHHGDNGPYNAFVRNMATGGIALVKTMHEWATLGNMEYQSLLYPLRFNWTDDAAPATDKYGLLENYTLPVPHNVAYSRGGYLDFKLDDVSYYYSSKPEFLDGYTWPAIGPETRTSGSLSYSIPAEVRYNYSKKTYLPNPTPKPSTTSGTLPYSQTWSGSHTLTGDITVPSSMTLTVAPGTYVYIPAGKKIAVNGTLKAQGTSGQPITFDRSGTSNWYGIKFEDSSVDGECILEYCTIRHASWGAYCYKSSPAIRNCMLTNNTTGIYTSYQTAPQDISENEIGYNWSGVSLTNISGVIVEFNDNDVHHSSFVNLNFLSTSNSTVIHNNEIRNCTSGNGVNLSSSSPNFAENSVYDNYGYGIKCLSSSPELEGDLYNSIPGNNVVAYNGSYGIYLDASSQPVLGHYDPDIAQNSYYSNGTYDVYSLFASYIAAGNCYWGDDCTPNIYGMVWFYPTLCDNPNPDPHSLQKSLAEADYKGTQEVAGDSTVNKEARLHYDKGYELEQKGEYEAALGEYDFVIAEYPQTLEAELSLNRITICNDKTKSSQATLSYMATIASDYSNLRVGGKAQAYLTKQLIRDADYKTALANCSDLVQKFPQSDLAKDALFTQWQIYFDGLQVMKSAGDAMHQYESSFPKDFSLAIMKIAMGEWTPEMEKDYAESLPKRGSEEMAEGSDVEKPKVFALIGNYPNPFNPETVIKYAVPKESHVLIEIHNVLGQRIRRLFDGDVPAGYHNLVWNGRNEAG